MFFRQAGAPWKAVLTRKDQGPLLPDIPLPHEISLVVLGEWIEGSEKFGRETQLEVIERRVELKKLSSDDSVTG